MVACSAVLDDGALGRAQVATGETRGRVKRDRRRDHGHAGGNARRRERPVEDIVILVPATG